MKVKENWTDLDFEVMSWHDSAIYSISFPPDSLEIIFDIDYLFKWVLNEETKLYNFWISPCSLTFFGVLFIKMDLDFSDSVGLNIEMITRMNPKVSPDNRIKIWTYLIETDKGNMSFESTGFSNKVKKQPVFSNSQILTRDN